MFAKRHRSLRIALLAGAATFALGAHAQATERTITGTVMDRQCEPLAGAVVQVHSESTLSVISYITGRNGSYIFKHLSPDDSYQVFATYRGSRSRRFRLSRFDSRLNRNLPLIIKLH